MHIVVEQGAEDTELDACSRGVQWQGCMPSAQVQLIIFGVRLHGYLDGAKQSSKMNDGTSPHIPKSPRCTTCGGPPTKRPPRIRRSFNRY